MEPFDWRKGTADKCDGVGPVFRVDVGAACSCSCWDRETAVEEKAAEVFKTIVLVLLCQNAKTERVRPLIEHCHLGADPQPTAQDPYKKKDSSQTPSPKNEEA